LILIYIIFGLRFFQLTLIFFSLIDTGPNYLLLM